MPLPPAKRFFRKIFANPANVQPRVINVDKNPAYPATIKELKDEGMLRRLVVVCVSPQVGLNNIIEQDHRTVKRRTWASGDGLWLVPQCLAHRVKQGIEAANMIRKGRIRLVAKEDPAGQARFVGSLFGIAG